MSEENISRLDYDRRLFGTSEINVVTSSAIEGLTDEQLTSPIRRTFLLFLFFKWILIIVIWLLYVGSLGDIAEMMRKEVLNMHFKTSLFDVQILSALCFLFLEITYGAFLMSRRWPCALTTGCMTVYMLTKCVLFDVKQARDSSLCYTALVIPIVLEWLVTLFLECRVLPQERKAKRIVTSYSRLNPDFDLFAEPAQMASVHRWAARTITSRGGNSVYGSPEGSLMEVQSLLNAPKYGPGDATDAPVDVAGLLSQAEGLRRTAWRVFEDEGWPAGGNASLASGPVIASADLQGFSQKVFRLDAIVHAKARLLFTDLVHGYEFSPLWNHSIAVARRLQKFPHEDLDIVHSMVKEVLGGLIKSRDFVMLRAWGERNGEYYIAACSVTHPKCPPSDQCIRAEQLINAIFIKPRDRLCHFTCISCFDLKGWVPGHVITRGARAFMSDFYVALQNRAASLSSGAEECELDGGGSYSDAPPLSQGLEDAC